jgi:hypothetical protein
MPGTSAELQSSLFDCHYVPGKFLFHESRRLIRPAKASGTLM